jgi:hypothetical protein
MSTYHPSEDVQDLANQSVYIDTTNPFDTETVQHILQQLPTPIKLHPSYHEVSRQIQSIICGLNITLGQRKFLYINGGFPPYITGTDKLYPCTVSIPIPKNVDFPQFCD